MRHLVSGRYPPQYLGTLPPLDELINLASYDYSPYGEQLDQGRRRRAGGGLGMGNGDGLGEGSLPEGQGMGSGAGLEPEGAVDGQGMESSGAGLGVSASPEAQDKRRGAIQTTLGYAGMFYHARSGLYLTHYRAYDPRLGRWLSRDPIWESGGINLYGYVGGDPVGWVDPLGLYPGEDIIEFFPDAIGADIDFAQNYVNMRQANTIGADKYFHCKANCEAASRGPGGTLESLILSELREQMDEHIKGDSPQSCIADRQANNRGRQGGRNNSKGESCQQICSPFRPMGLPPNY